MKKKKILVAVLASLCVAAGAAGIAACSSGGSAQDSALYAAYQTYVSQTADPLSYEDWLADIIEKFYSSPEGPAGEQGTVVESIQIVTSNRKQYYEFRLSNGKVVRIAVDGSDVQSSTAFSFKSVDQRNSPVADVYFSIGYQNGSSSSSNTYLKSDGTTTTNAAEAAVVKTDEDGLATMHLFPEDPNLVYRVYIANPVAIANAGYSAVSGTPEGFLRNYFGTNSNGDAYTSAALDKNDDGSFSITVTFNMDNSWATGFSRSNNIKYTRSPGENYANDHNDVYESYRHLVKGVSKNRLNYFTIAPFVGTYVTDEDEMGAASGFYRAYWTASDPDANVELISYLFTGVNNEFSIFLTNNDGSPSDVYIKQRSGNPTTDETYLRSLYNAYRRDGYNQNYDVWLESYNASYTGTNYVDMEIEYEYAFAEFCFGFVADRDCEVTIEIERIGNVPTWRSVRVDAELPENALTEVADHTGRVLDVPFNSAIVKDDEGFYHIDSVTGPLVYVQLMGGTRVTADSIYELCHYETSEGPVSSFNNYQTGEEFDEFTNEGIRTYTDYTKVLEWYAEHSNSKGLYPLNDQIKYVLERFSTAMSDWLSYDQYWLAACSYYGAEADGSANAPYDLVAGENVIELRPDGVTYVSFRTYSMAYYSITSADAELTIPGLIDIDGVAFVRMNANQELIFTVTGSGATATINIAEIESTAIIEYTFDEERGGRGTESNPINIGQEGFYQVNIDHNMSNDQPLVVELTALPIVFDGEFLIQVFGGEHATVLDANRNDLNGKTLTLHFDMMSGTYDSVRMYIDDTVDGSFFIKITKVA